VTTHRDKFQEDVRFRVLRLLEENPEMSQRNLAQAVGISLGSLHYCLTALVEKGLVVIGNFTAAEDKRRYAYVLTPKGLRERAALTRDFLKRKRAEYQALKVEIETLQEELELGAEMKPSPSGKSRQSH
jgi:EPS-associated MarR family transcriptional regulator